MLTELEECVNQLRFDSNCRVVIVKSLVDGVFCAGADLKERSTMNQQQVSQFVFQLRKVFTQLEVGRFIDANNMK
jgi:methylglutaconyl-CoA hydratase